MHGMRYDKHPTSQPRLIHKSMKATRHTPSREEIEMFSARYSSAHNEGLVTHDKYASDGGCRERSPIVYGAFRSTRLPNGESGWGGDFDWFEKWGVGFGSALPTMSKTLSHH